jgi:hypothetical protein
MNVSKIIAFTVLYSYSVVSAKREDLDCSQGMKCQVQRFEKVSIVF